MELSNGVSMPLLGLGTWKSEVRLDCTEQLVCFAFPNLVRWQWLAGRERERGC